MLRIDLDSPAGPLLLEFDRRGLRRLYFLDRRETPVAPSEPASEAPSFVRETVRLLREYFAGGKVDFRGAPLNLEVGTPFQRRVWKELRRLGYGELISSGELARRVGRPGAARAVGLALAANPVPIVIPCHRVIRSDGGLGGFSAGLERKRVLLKLEGHDF